MRAEFFDRAACKDSDSALFFPDMDVRTEAGAKATAEARRICGTCEVSAECLQYALDHHIKDGIWGGLNPATVKRAEQKVRERDRKRAVNANLPPRFAKSVSSHGTRTGFVAGCRCEECTAAQRAYDRSRTRVDA